MEKQEEKDMTADQRKIAEMEKDQEVTKGYRVVRVSTWDKLALSRKKINTLKNGKKKLKATSDQEEVRISIQDAVNQEAVSGWHFAGHFVAYGIDFFVFSKNPDRPNFMSIEELLLQETG